RCRRSFLVRTRAETRIEGLVIRLTDRAPRGCDQIDQVVDHRLLHTLARVLKVEVAVALLGEEDRVTQVLLGSPGVGIARVGVIALVDQQDRVRGAGVPRPPVVVLGADRPGGAGGPLPPALYAALEPADLLESSDHLRPRLRALIGRPVGALDRRR